LVSGIVAAQRVRHAYGHLALAPDLEDGLIVGRQQVVAARIDDTSESQAVQLREEFLGAVHLLFEGRPWKAVEQRDDGVLAACDFTSGSELAAGGKIGVAANVESAQTGGSENRPAITELHIYGIIGGGCD